MPDVIFNAFNPNKAYLSHKELVPLSQALGRVVAVHVNLYPPGDMYLCAGETLLPSHVKALNTAIADGEELQGILLTNGSPHIWVVEEPDYEIVIKNPQTLTGKEIEDYTSLYREVFSNSPYNAMAYREGAWNVPLSAAEVILGRQGSRRDYVDIQTIDDFQLPQGLRRYMDPDETKRVLIDRFSDPGYMALLYEMATQTLRGFCFARVVTLQRVWETEEFKWPLILSGNRHVQANESIFFRKMDAAFNLKPESQVLSVSGQAIHPKVRGRDGWFGKIMAATASQITPQHASLPGLTEISRTGSGRILNAAVSTKVVSGILENGNPLAYMPLASHSLWCYEGPPSRLKSVIRAQIRKERRNV